LTQQRSASAVLDNIEEGEVFWKCPKEICLQQQPWSYATHLLFQRTRMRNSAFLPTSATSLFSDPISCTHCASLGLSPKKPMQSLLKGMLHQVNPLSCLILLFSMHRFSCFLDPHPFNTILDVCKSKWDEIDYNSFKVFRYRFEVDCVSYNVIVNGWLCDEKNNPSSCTASDGVWLW
jgi:hypothetical protein